MDCFPGFCIPKPIDTVIPWFGALFKPIPQLIVWSMLIGAVAIIVLISMNRDRQERTIIAKDIPYYQKRYRIRDIDFCGISSRLVTLAVITAKRLTVKPR